MFSMFPCPNGQRRPHGAVAAAVLAASLALLGGCPSAPDTSTRNTAEPSPSEANKSRIEVSRAWSRETAPGQDAGGAFLTMTNTGQAADRLIGGSSPAAGEVQVHTMTVDDGIMRMRKLPKGLNIPAGTTMTLEPGGNHVMLMDLNAPLRSGTAVPITLEFERAGRIRIDAQVRSMTQDAGLEVR